MTRDEYLFDYDAVPILHDQFHDMTVQVDCTILFSTPNISVYNTAGSPHTNSTKVATLSLLTDEIFYRGEDWLEPWRLTKRQIKMIRWILRFGHPCECRYSYWQLACRYWNEIRDEDNEIGFPINWKYRCLFDKKFDEIYKDNPLYIPSTQPIPHWHY